MTGSEADAEDMTQEVLLQVVRRLDTFRGDARLSTWLHRVTVNAVLALRRRRGSDREQQCAAGGEAELASYGRRGRPAAAPDEAALAGERRGRLEAAIGGLPPAYRDPFVLSDVEGLSDVEVSNLLGLSVSAVKTRLHRAGLMLRDALAGLG
jgi:RNA polymerase sigma-70 factor (ECF subfamily)